MGHLKEKTATLNWHLCFGRKVIILSLPPFKIFFKPVLIAHFSCLIYHSPEKTSR